MLDSERELSYAESDDERLLRLTKADLKVFRWRIGERAAMTVLDALQGP